MKGKIILEGIEVSDFMEILTNEFKKANYYDPNIGFTFHQMKQALGIKDNRTLKAKIEKKQILVEYLAGEPRYFFPEIMSKKSRAAS